MRRKEPKYKKREKNCLTGYGDGPKYCPTSPRLSSECDCTDCRTK